MVQVSASLLAADFTRLGEQARQAEAAGVDSFHFDMMDGHYVPNLAFAPDHLSALHAQTRLPFHAHLELNNPDSVLGNFRPFPADLIIVCLNTLPDPERTLERIRSRQAQAGISLNPGESPARVRSLLPALDLLLVLGVHPGFGGQPMQPNLPERVAQAAGLRQQLGLALPIAVDGGVNLDTAPALVEAGADILIVGTALFQAPDMGVFVNNLKGCAAGPRYR